MQQEHPWLLPVILATFSLIIIPLLTRLGIMFFEGRRAKRNEEIAAAIKSSLAPIEERQEIRHSENKALLTGIQGDAMRREGAITARLDLLHKDVQTEAATRQTQNETLNQRIFDVLRANGVNRRSSDS